MSSSDAIFIANLNNASAQINRYLSIVVFLFGTVGNILNTLVLSQRTLRSNPCAWFFLVSSLANLVAIFSGLTTRMLSGWAVDLTNTIGWLCKMRAFVLFTSRTIASWLIMMATVDRWLLSCTNVQRRQKSSMKNAKRGLILITIIASILYGCIFYCYEANQVNTPLKCYGQTELCRLINDLSYAFATIMSPIVLMIYFGLMTIINIHQSQGRVHNTSVSRINPSAVTSANPRRLKKKTDRQLLIMLLVQVILLSIFTLPQAIQKIYSTITSNWQKSAKQNAIDNFVFNFVLLLTYFASGIPFYIYTLSGGKVFRSALGNLFRRVG